MVTLQGLTATHYFRKPAIHPTVAVPSGFYYTDAASGDFPGDSGAAGLRRLRAIRSACSTLVGASPVSIVAGTGRQ